MLRRLRDLSSSPWLCAGDFNEVTSFSEKKGGRAKSLRELRLFSDTLEDCDLVDLGFVGPPFTWRNGQEARRHVQEHLDRAVATKP